MAPLTNEDKILIKTLRIDEGWSALRMIREFPLRNWKKRNLCNLIKRIDDNGEIDRKRGSGPHRGLPPCRGGGAYALMTRTII